MEAPDNLRDLFEWNAAGTVHTKLARVMGDVANALEDKGWSEELKEVVQNPAPGIYTYPLLSRDFCKALVWFSDMVGSYQPDPGDPYPGQELVTTSVKPLHAIVENIFEGYMAPIIAMCFDGYDVDKIDGSFVLKYSEDTQKSMGSHFDGQSDVSLTVVLNDGFEGGGLHFPRYDWSSKGLEPGSAVLFPGRVTHRHAGLEITKGKRYALVMWLRGDS